tara:strand:- start:461 stop:874 length:414 start_codon:yes stop_codon:yes gene_type:complete
MTLRGNTDYALARSSKDYREANEFLKSEGVDYTGLSFPTIIARRPKGVIGVISTIKGEKRVTMGPLHINVGEGNEIYTSIRMMSCYDGILKEAGVTKYWFWILAENKELVETCRQLGSYKEVEMNDNEDFVWFERSL